MDASCAFSPGGSGGGEGEWLRAFLRLVGGDEGETLSLTGPLVFSGLTGGAGLGGFNGFTGLQLICVKSQPYH